MKRSDSGFSMVELTVAMLITLLISGAIYGLIGSGSNMFRREPALSDRQQNIRIAMDTITREAEEARGFTARNAAGFAGPNGVNTDWLEMLVPNDTCPDIAAGPHNGNSIEIT